MNTSSTHLAATEQSFFSIFVSTRPPQPSLLGYFDTMKPAKRFHVHVGVNAELTHLVLQVTETSVNRRDCNTTRDLPSDRGVHLTCNVTILLSFQFGIVLMDRWGATLLHHSQAKFSSTDMQSELRKAISITK